MNWRELGKQAIDSEKASIAASEAAKVASEAAKVAEAETRARERELLDEQAREPLLPILNKYSPEKHFTEINKQIWGGIGLIKNTRSLSDLLIEDYETRRYYPDFSTPLPVFTDNKSRNFLTVGVSLSAIYHHVDTITTGNNEWGKRDETVLFLSGYEDRISVIKLDDSYFVLLNSISAGDSHSYAGSSNLRKETRNIALKYSDSQDLSPLINHWLALVCFNREKSESLPNLSDIEGSVRRAYKRFPEDPRVLKDIERYNIQI